MPDEPGPSPAAPSTSSSTPTRARTHDAVVLLLAQAARVPPMPRLSFNTLWSKLFSSASATKIFACSARHDTCAKPAVPRHAPAHEALLRLPMEGLRADVARLALRVLRARLAATATASAYFLFALYCSAPPAFFIFLQSWSWPALFPVLHLAFGPTVARAAAAAFLAQG